MIDTNGVWWRARSRLFEVNIFHKPLWNKLLFAAGLALLFALYTWGILEDLPGFYVDESVLAYNAYLLSRTGAGEFGDVFPLYFHFFPDGFAQYCSPTQVYLLAAVFTVFPASILTARLFSAFWVFGACIGLGVLAYRISGKNRIVAALVSGTALLTPWLFDLRGLVFEPHFVPFAVVMFLIALHRAHTGERWGWKEGAWIAAGLLLITYCYTSGRVLGLMFAGALIVFATSKTRLISVIKTWVLYGLTLVPLIIFNLRNPGLLTKRFYEVTYIRPDQSWGELLNKFVTRFLEDQALQGMLFNGDSLPRHHVTASGGAILVATFLLAVIGLALAVGRCLRDPWWRFVAIGLPVCIVPGAVTTWPFHQLRLNAFPVFLLVLTIPAFEFLLKGYLECGECPYNPSVATDAGLSFFSLPKLSSRVRFAILAILLALTGLQAAWYQAVFRQEARKREFYFDFSYKAAYDAAVSQPSRPIYLEDGFWGPAYAHALWYATIEGRPTDEFFHLTSGAKAPPESVVISSESNCQNCEILQRSGSYLLYRTR